MHSVELSIIQLLVQYLQLKEKLSVFLLLLFPFFCFGNQITQQERIQDHLMIHDFSSAEEEARAAFHQDSDSLVFFKLYLESLASQGKMDDMLNVWGQFQKKHPEILDDPALLEILAWAMIENAAEALKPSIRAAALSAAAKSQTVKGIHLLERGLSDRNAWVRMQTVRLASSLLDASIKKRILHLAYAEAQLNVRIEAVRCLGRMQIFEGQELLKSMISLDESAPELKSAAIEALVLLLDTVPREEIIQLVQSERMGLRLLAARAVMLLGLKRDVDLLLPLLGDPSYAVRIATIQALGTLERFADEKIEPLLKDSHPDVAITACWYFALRSSAEMFQKWLVHKEQDVRLFAACALASSGRVKEMEKQLVLNTDPLVKLNLAIGLVHYRHAISLACETICAQLSSSQRWMWREEGIWRGVVPSQVFHTREWPHLPKAMDQTVKLELLRMILVLNHPGAAQALEIFLQKSVADITPLVMSLLLKEGGVESVQGVRHLMKGSDQQVRAHACLLLALWEQDPLAIEELKTLYHLFPRSIKERLLYGMGEIGEASLVSFFIDQMRFGSKNLQLIAAVGLLQSLNLSKGPASQSP